MSVANFCIPTVCEWLNEVKFVELGEKEAQETVQKYNKQGREAGYGPNFSNKKPSGDSSKKQWGRNNSSYFNITMLFFYLVLWFFTGHDNRSNRWGGRGHDNRDRHWGNQRSGGGWGRNDNRNHHGVGGNWRGSGNNRILSGGSSYNRNQGGGYNRNKNQQHNRNPGPGKMRKVGYIFFISYKFVHYVFVI